MTGSGAPEQATAQAAHDKRQALRARLVERALRERQAHQADGGAEASLVPIRAAGAVPTRRDTVPPGDTPDPGGAESSGERPPLFLVHAVGGSVAPYIPLASLLDPGQPVYGIQAPGLDGGETVPRLDELAERYLGLIRGVRPAGPYLLGGWSAGGAIAAELAIRLCDGGADVALLAMIDTSLPPSDLEPPDQAALLSVFCNDVAALHDATPPPVDVAGLRLMPAERQVDTVITALEEARLVPLFVRDEIRRRFAVFAATMDAFLQYRPRPVDLPVIMLEAVGSLSGKAAQWRPFAPAGLRYHVVPGGHYTMLQPPHVGELARTLSQCLEAATAATHL